MKIESVRIQNFRCFSDETIQFGNYTSLVGPNGAGKSSVLGALNVVFRNSDSPFDVSHLSVEDFHHKNVSQPVKITVTFRDLSDAAKEDLKAYVRHDTLVFSAKAEWNADAERAEVRQFGSRYVMTKFVPFFEAYERGEKALGLKSIYGSIREDFLELPDIKTKDGMRDALREYEEAHEDQCELVESGDNFYGWTKGANLLQRHFQWVYVPAVKNPAEEQDEAKGSALGKLLQRTIRARVDFAAGVAKIRSAAADEYQKLLHAEAELLSDVGEGLERRLREWSHPATKVKLIWNYDDQKSVRVEEPMARVKVGEGEFLGDLIRLGHGVQRSFLVALLQELIDAGEGGGPTLVLAIEEPELYQHPPQARHFAAVLEQHSEDGAQVVLTTHSPYFVSGSGFESVRMTRKASGADESRVTQLSHAELSEVIGEALGEEPSSPTATMAAIEQILQPSQSELFFSRVPVFVEGTEDVAYLSTHLRLTGRWADFRRLGCHFIVCGGKNAMSRPVAIAKGLELPFYCVFDGDSGKCKDAASTFSHERDNRCLLSLCGHIAEPIASDHEWGNCCTMWTDDVGAAVRADVGKEAWESAESKARADHGFAGGTSRKNALLVAATVEELGRGGVTIGVLQTLSERLLDFAESHQSKPVGDGAAIPG